MFLWNKRTGIEKLLKLQILWKNTSNKSCSQLNFLQISQWVNVSIAPRSEARKLQKLPNLSRFTLGLKATKNTHCIKKKLRIKVVKNWILYKKFRERICLFPPWVELRASNDQYIWNLFMYRNGKLDSLQGSPLSRIRIVSKKASNKSCSELNFVQKSTLGHMSISLKSGARGLQRSVCLKSFNVQKWEIRFALGLNTAKDTHYIIKSFKLNMFRIEFRTKKSARAYVYLPHTWSLRAPNRGRWVHNQLTGHSVCRRQFLGSI